MSRKIFHKPSGIKSPSINVNYCGWINYFWIYVCRTLKNILLLCLKITRQLQVALNSQRSFYLGFQNAGITGICQHTLQHLPYFIGLSTSVTIASISVFLFLNIILYFRECIECILQKAILDAIQIYQNYLSHIKPFCFLYSFIYLILSQKCQNIL